MKNKKQVEIKEGKKLCEMCLERNEPQPREATHVHYKYYKDKPLKTNHRIAQKKNPELFQDLCTICHSEVHGNEPKRSALSDAVTLRDILIKRRGVITNQLRGLDGIELAVPELWTTELESVSDQISALEKEIKIQVESLPEKEYPVQWALSIKGVGPCTVGKIFSCIDSPLLENSRTHSVSSLWRLCGLDPTHIKRPRKENGGKLSGAEAKKFGNPYLKKEVRLLSENLMKQNTPKYRALYDTTRDNEIQLEKKHGVDVVVPGTKKKTVKVATRVEKDKETGEEKEVNSHAHSRALRRVGKEFLKDLYLEWQKLDHNKFETQI